MGKVNFGYILGWSVIFMVAIHRIVSLITPVTQVRAGRCFCLSEPSCLLVPLASRAAHLSTSAPQGLPAPAPVRVLCAGLSPPSARACGGCGELCVGCRRDISHPRVRSRVRGQGMEFYRCASLLGYCLLPIVLVSAVAVVLSRRAGGGGGGGVVWGWAETVA